MSDINSASWSEVDASNNSATPNGWPEGQAPSSVNDCARAMMGAIRRWFNRERAVASKTVGGTGNAVTLTHSVAASAYTQGDVFEWKATAANSGAVTLNVDALGAVNVFRRSLVGSPVALVGGEIQVGDIVRVEYDGTQFQAIGIAPTRAVVMWASAIAVAAGQTVFVGPAGASSTESNVQVPAPFAGRIRNLQVFCAVAPGVGQSITGTLMIGGVAQALTAAVSGATNSAGDTTHSVSVAATAVIDVRIVASAGAASSFIGVSFEVVTP